MIQFYKNVKHNKIRPLRTESICSYMSKLTLSNFCFQTEGLLFIYLKKMSTS